MNRRALWLVWRWLLGATLGVVALAYVACWVRYLAFPYGVFGWAADNVLLNAWQIARGQAVYADPATEPLTAYLYTPGLALMLAPLVAWFGPQLWVAQLVNGLGAAIIVTLVAREARRRVAAASGTPSAAGAAPRAAGLVFLLGTASLSAILWVHPEAWAVAWTLLMLCALAGGEGAARLACAVLCAIAAVATKQTALSAVVAATISLLACRPRAALAFAGTVAVALAGLFLFGEARSAGHFSDYVLLGLGHPLQPELLPDILRWLAVYLGPCLAIVVPHLARRARQEGLRVLLADPWTCAALVMLPSHALVMMKADAIPNNLLGPSMVIIPLFVAAAWDLAARWGHGSAGVPRPTALAAAALLFLALAAWRAWQDLPQLAAQLERHAGRTAVAHEIEQRLAEVTAAGAGPAWVAHSPLFALHAGQPIETTALVLHEFEDTEPESSERLLRRIDAGEFALILLPEGFFGMVSEERWRPRLDARYRVERVIGGPEPGRPDGVAWGVFTPAIVLVRR